MTLCVYGGFMCLCVLHRLYHIFVHQRALKRLKKTNYHDFYFSISLFLSLSLFLFILSYRKIETFCFILVFWADTFLFLIHPSSLSFSVVLLSQLWKVPKILCCNGALLNVSHHYSHLAECVCVCFCVVGVVTCCVWILIILFY